jgi:hypothetical protein
MPVVVEGKTQCQWRMPTARHQTRNSFMKRHNLTPHPLGPNAHTSVHRLTHTHKHTQQMQCPNAHTSVHRLTHTHKHTQQMQCRIGSCSASAMIVFTDCNGGPFGGFSSCSNFYLVHCCVPNRVARGSDTTVAERSANIGITLTKGVPFV